MHYPLLQRALENFNESDLATKPTLDSRKRDRTQHARNFI